MAAVLLSWFAVAICAVPVAAIPPLAPPGRPLTLPAWRVTYPEHVAHPTAPKVGLAPADAPRLRSQLLMEPTSISPKRPDSSYPTTASADARVQDATYLAQHELAVAASAIDGYRVALSILLVFWVATVGVHWHWRRASNFDSSGRSGHNGASKSVADVEMVFSAPAVCEVEPHLGSLLTTDPKFAVAAVTGAQSTAVADQEDRDAWVESFPVYIEDTDCFRVVFYANYFRYFLRLLARRFSHAGAGLPILLAITGAKYSRPARLGDMLRVRAEEITNDASSPLRHFQVTSETDSGPCVSAELIVADMGTLGGDVKWPSESLPQQSANGLGAPTEISSFEHGAYSPEAWDVLRWFERSRTDFLGGPQNLEEFQRRSGMLVVVARMADFVYDRATTAGADLCGRDVAFTVRSSIEVKRRDTLLVFDQRLFIGEDGPCVARAVVTCLCVNSATEKLMACPADVKAGLLAKLE